MYALKTGPQLRNPTKKKENWTEKKEALSQPFENQLFPGYRLINHCTHDKSCVAGILKRGRLQPLY